GFRRDACASPRSDRGETRCGGGEGAIGEAFFATWNYAVRMTHEISTSSVPGKNLSLTRLVSFPSSIDRSMRRFAVACQALFEGDGQLGVGVNVDCFPFAVGGDA